MRFICVIVLSSKQTKRTQPVLHNASHTATYALGRQSHDIHIKDTSIPFPYIVLSKKNPTCANKITHGDLTVPREPGDGVGHS